MPTTNLLSSDLPISGETILIIGNRSYKNMGDELILLGTVKLLLGLLP
ncbi:MAG: hypothetical protein LBO09_08310 [Candidatus Peribacteria bacterium]|nr:hypothetical protein [Candidatus Peribacteria bacterium]